jgi:hypothetical protein
MVRSLNSVSKRKMTYNSIESTPRVRVWKVWLSDGVLVGDTGVEGGWRWRFGADLFVWVNGLAGGKSNWFEDGGGGALVPVEVDRESSWPENGGKSVRW